MSFQIEASALNEPRVDSSPILVRLFTIFKQPLFFDKLYPHGDGPHPVTDLDPMTDKGHFIARWNYLQLGLGGTIATGTAVKRADESERCRPTNAERTSLSAPAHLSLSEQLKSTPHIVPDRHIAACHRLF